MRCLGCKAWKDGKCLAGVTPYRSKNERDGIGGACNTRTVEKLIRQNRKTNADRIRSMTDDELADLWWERVDCGECPVHRDCRMTGQDCKELALGWLQEEAKE